MFYVNETPGLLTQVFVFRTMAAEDHWTTLLVCLPVFLSSRLLVRSFLSLSLFLLLVFP